jgi:hypothetical protein
MDNRHPWDVEQKLTRERLLMLMDVIVRQRKELQPLYTKGDSPWSHGCRAYSWILGGFEELEADLHARGETWLRVERNNNFFNLWIDEVLVRMYRGDPEKPRERTLRIGQQLQGCLPGILVDGNEEATSEWVWMISYESAPMPRLWKDMQPTDGHGLVISVSICQARSAASAHQEADTRYSWTHMVGTGNIALTAATDHVAQPFEPAPPKVRIPKLGKREKKEDGNNDRGDA